MTEIDWSEIEQRAQQVFEALDWDALGEIYFHDDGQQRWQERQGKVLSLGMRLAHRLQIQLPESGCSLWVGAGVAELPVLLAERLAMGRQSLATNLIDAECRVLNAALERVLPDLGMRYECVDAGTLRPEVQVDHVGCISVFTDPETYPTLSGVAYGRLPCVQLDLEVFAAEREQARELAASLFDRLRPRATVTTTPEEVAWFLEQAERRGVELQASEDLVETAVVGDPVGFLTLQ